MFCTGRTIVRNSLKINFLHNFIHTEITKVRTSGFLLIKFRRLQVSSRYCSNMPAKKDFERLPTNIRPVNYCLRLKPNLKSFTFEGTETIDVEVTSSSQTVTLNSVDIDIQRATYQSSGQPEPVIGEIAYNKEDEKVTLTFPSQLQEGSGKLFIQFTGELNDKMKGFYRSKYTSDGEERFCAVTQFEATDARRAFPCWDEPAVKATFDVTLVVPKNRVALSNMPVKSEKDLDTDAQWKVVSYEQTPIMSTYLLAFVVGEYDYVEAFDKDGVKVRVYTPVGKKEQGQFALDVAVKTLPFYKDYFQIAYPLPKMDLIAIADFAAGAMENWGLVTYRETALLIDPKNSSSKTKQWVALVVGHELAHQWFGNLVTMEWWTHLWLNEGFASWIEYLCVDHCFPEYDIWTQFVNSDLGRALELDALNNSHPIEVPVGHPDEVDEIFDAISYSKGASDFRKGMNSYLTKYKYKNAFTENLWESLEAASGKPVQSVMTTWTKQMGYPVIKVVEKQEGSDKSQWMVPVSICTTSSPTTPAKMILLDKPSVSVTVENVKPTDWIKVNAGTVGVYRVQYTSEMLDKLIPAIKDSSLPPRDRLGLQSDLFALSRAGSVSAVDVLKVAEAYLNEKDYTVWNDLSLNLSGVSIPLQYTESRDDFKRYIRHLTAMLRDLVLTKMGRNGDEATVAEAQRRFEEHVSGAKPLPADLRTPVYLTVLSNGGEETFNKMLKLYDEADMQEEKVRIARSLGAVKTESLIEKVLEFSMSDKVRSQDTVFVMASVTGSVLGREMFWKFTQKRWEELITRYKGGFLLSRLVKSTENFASEEKAKEVEEFFKTHPAPAAERTVQQSCENIRLNAAWLSRESERVGQFLKSR
ncbi:hypothetical protein KUTeg_005206 [Tegillarca granosa]|uniref:Aminopeptidase n=1 Tax=Tegillarca granosa TaxID=220873 RepID=A0ABQ9FJ25_TEGGR|nr:hypothetical protein KUTeg_005206 [Tegillarca granosa]